MAQTELNVTAREVVGKGGARSLRRQGLVPAVVYGKGLDACNVVVAPKALQAAIATEAGWNTLITLKGKKVDFQAIDLQKKVHVMVPVHPVGKSAGEKAGGHLQVIRHELEVVCLPTAIPSAIEIDVETLGIGDVLHINDVVLPAGVEAPHDVNFTVITVTGHKAEEAAEGEEAEEA